MTLRSAFLFFAFYFHFLNFSFSQSRLWGTYYGGTANDRIIAITVDASNNIIVTGQTSSADSNVIATSGTHQQTLDGTGDCFVAKFDKNGNRLWGTYFGGSGAEYGRGIAVDNNGFILVTGVTTSSNGVSSAGAHQVNYGGGATDAFLAKFSTDGTLLWSTYYGGTNWDRGYAVAADTSGNIILLGETATDDSSGFSIATAGSFQSLYGGGSSDGFMAKFSPSGVRLWATYLGGDSLDHAHSAITDSLNNVFILGGTTDTGSAPNAIATAGAYQPQNNGREDSFLMKFDANGNRLWGTYYGGNGDDEGYLLAQDAGGDLVFCGYSTSTDSTAGITTAGTHQEKNGGGMWDGFLSKFSSNGSRLWGTFYGGTGDDRALGVSIFSDNKILFSGFTTTNSFNGEIGTAGSWLANYAGGNFDGCFALFNSAGMRLWGTYFGGTGDDGANACAINFSDEIIVSGFSSTAGNAPNAIATTGAHQTVYGGDPADAVLAVFDKCNPAALNISVADTAAFCAGDSAVLNAGSGYITYLWNTGSTTQIITVFSPGTFFVSAVDSNNCTVFSDTVAISVFANPVSSFTFQSLGDSVVFSDTITSNPILCSIVWDFGDNTNSSLLNPSHTYSANGTYTVCHKVVSCNGCSDSSCVQVIITAVGVNEAMPAKVAVYPNPFTETATLRITNGSRTANYELKIYNVFGKETHIPVIRNSEGFVVRRGNASGGVYFYKLFLEKKMITAGKLLSE